MSNKPEPGSYLLLLETRRAQHITIGKLGRFHFPKGYYCYTGSAMGPGGLAARLGRHKRLSNKTKRWHIDYLRSHSRYVGAWFEPGINRECEFAAALQDAAANADRGLAGFPGCRLELGRRA